MTRARIDQLLVERGLVQSRARAQALILAGLVSIEGARIAKAGQLVSAQSAIVVKGRDHPWVGRGGVKLAHALDRLGWRDLTGATVLDVGASTGGFTDVALQAGATKVFAVDVGHGQLDWRLRSDQRVVVLERTNARYLTRAEVPDPIDLIVCDASFIGLATVLPAPLVLAASRARLVALIKPQFEAGPREVGAKGVVRDPAVHARVQAEAAAFVGAQPGWRVIGITPSPITGPEGNVEFLLGAVREG